MTKFSSLLVYTIDLGNEFCPALGFICASESNVFSLSNFFPALGEFRRLAFLR